MPLECDPCASHKSDSRNRCYPRGMALQRADFSCE
jgi:hypothetical protein